MTEIYLIRHAQAEGNLYRMMQGHWDGDVTDMGLRQIDTLAERFKNVHVDALYSSDLYRTRLTASAITRYHELPMNLSPMLREINVGPWETKFFANVTHAEPESAHYFMFDPDSWYKEGAETYGQVGERAFAFLDETVRHHANQAVVFVSHGVTIRCLLSKISGMSLQDTENLPICRNTAVSKLLWEDGKYTVEYMNDFSHILPLGAAPWNKTAELRDESFDPSVDRDFYISCYADAWKSAHGSLDNFCADTYYASALQHYREDNGAVLRILDGEKPVGLVDMDTRRGIHADIGWISLLYLKEDYRNQEYGIQLLARALSKYAELGRKVLRLQVAEDNAQAIAFYKKYGFGELSRESTPSGALLLMERKPGRRQDV